MNPLFQDQALTAMVYGGDYNPEQWPEAVWQEDARLMQQAGVNLVSLAIFSWAKIEPQPGVYQFEWLDRVIDLLYEHGIYINLATATASPPPWFSRRHPESLPVNADGQRYHPGSRQHYCPNSVAYKAAARDLVAQMVERYHAHPAVVMWHVNNEYACHNSECYCDQCSAEFQRWLQQRYGTIQQLNDAWATTFWSQTYTDWAEIQLPNRTITFYNPGHLLDYRRFMNDAILALYRLEAKAIRAMGAEQPITTNFFIGGKGLDYYQWAKEMDLVALDVYPDPTGGAQTWQEAAFWHDLTRSQGQGRPFVVMEQATTQVNWRSVNRLKPPGMMRALSYQAIGRGADGIMFFQWRQSRGGAEKFHSAMVPHGPVDKSRIFEEVAQLGNELTQLSAVTASRVPARVALLFSYENWWALELKGKPAELDGLADILPWYRALIDLNVPVDIAHPDQDLSQYDVVVAPLLYQLTQAQADALHTFVAAGGTLLMTYFSGVVDESERVWLGGYPALLQEMLGLTVEEWQPLLPDEAVGMQVGSAEIRCEHWADLVHPTSAETLATFTQTFFAGRPAFTRNDHGKGTAYYLATRPEAAALRSLLADLLRVADAAPALTTPPNVECTWRESDDATYLIVINHNPDSAEIDFGAFRGVDLLTGVSVAGTRTLQPVETLIVELDG